MPALITFNDSYYAKTNPENYVNAMKATVGDTADATMSECQSECPVRTGNLRDSHFVEKDEFTATIHNSAEYWIYVVYGTSRMASNNYPMRAWNTIRSENVIGTIYMNRLKENGIDVQ